MSEARWDLPESWTWAAAGDLARIVGGGTPSSRVDSYFAENGIPWITPADLTGYRHSHISRGRRDLSKEGFDSCGAQMIPAGSVLFSSRAPIGYCVIASNDVSTNQGFKSLVLQGDIVPEYIRYYLISAKDYAESRASGTTFMELSGARVAKLSIPIAPIQEQKRIVAKVGGLTARTARARADLDCIPTLIARYKQRLLAIAFSGKLTSHWRTENELPAPKIGTLEAIIDEGPTNGWSPPSTGNSSGALSLKLTATTSGKLRLDEAAVKRIDATPPLDSKLWLVPGDLLIQRANSLEYVGAAAIFDGPEKTYIYPDLMMRVRINNSTTREFTWRYLNSDIARAYFRENATGTSGNMPKINGKVLRSTPVPIFSMEEQAEINRHLELAFNWLDRMAADHARAAKILPKLDVAILAKAFRGELVPQGPNDEPASALLARIKEKQLETPQKVRARSPNTVPELPPSLVAGSTLPRPAKESAMTKSRQDDDVMGKPYLANLLKLGHGASAQDLFKAADLPVADFYKQLAWEIAQKHIRDADDKLEAL